jgi:ribosomal protein S1
MNKLAVGDLIEADVTRVEVYGVYLKFRDEEIVVLIPDVSHERVSDLRSRYTVGDRIRVRILEYVPERSLFKASIKDAE